MSYALTDEVYATTVKEMEGNKKEKYLFYGSAMITFWAIWVLADFLGALVGASFPTLRNTVSISPWSPPLSPSWCRKLKAACTVAAVVAAVSGVLLVVLPYSLGIVVASVLGVLAGLCVDGGRAQADGKTESDMPLVEAMENE